MESRASINSAAEVGVLNRQNVVNALMNPIDLPSGLSEGHISPYWLPCKRRGAAMFNDLSICRLMRRKWDKVLYYDNRDSSCEIPFLPPHCPLNDFSNSF